MSLLNGLNIRKKPPARASVFGDADDISTAASTDRREPTRVARSSLATEAAVLSGAEAAAAYDYDGVYDALKSADRAGAAARELAKRDRRPMYMADLLSASAARKRDRQRVEDDRLRAEREAEEAAGILPTEKFVTSGYREKLAADDAAREADAGADAEQEQQSAGDVAQFARTQAMQAAQRREAAVAASLGARLDDNVGDDGAHTPRESDVRAFSSSRPGLHVRRNDADEVVDKRELLSAGLNKPVATSRHDGGDDGDGASHLRRDASRDRHRARHDARGHDRGASERSRQDLRQQLAEKDDRERAARAAQERALLDSLKRRNTDAQVAAARQRYLERKRFRDAAARTVASASATTS